MTKDLGSCQVMIVFLLEVMGISLVDFYGLDCKFKKKLLVIFALSIRQLLSYLVFYYFIQNHGATARQDN